MTRKTRSLRVSVLPEVLTICRLGPEADVPRWAAGGAFWSITRTADELSIVAPQRRVPADIRAEGAWRAFKVEGPIPLATVGVLASIAEPLARAGISLFAISTFDTDYILVQADHVNAAQVALSDAGHTMC